MDAVFRRQQAGPQLRLRLVGETISDAERVFLNA
jgi:hypothetical protein